MTTQSNIHGALTAVLSNGPTNGRAILDAGIGAERHSRVTAGFIPYSKGAITYLERNVARANVARGALGDKIRLIEDRLETFCIGRSFDLIYVDVLPRDLGRLSHDLLPCVRALARPGAHVLITVPVGAVPPAAETPDWSAFAAAAARVAAAQSTIAAEVGRAMETRLGAGILASGESLHQPLRGFTWRTFVLEINGQPAAAAKSPLDDSPQHFSLADYGAFIDALKRDVDFVCVPDFVARLKQRVPHPRPVHTLKHDVHHDLLATWRMAHLEADLGVRGTYFFMHPHELTRAYDQRPETIEMMLEIQSLGHKIGLHVDALDLLQDDRGIPCRLETFLRKLRAGGVLIESANTHGNTHFFGLRDEFLYNQIFAEIAELSGTIHPEVQPYVRKYGHLSLAHWSSSYGLTHWLDTEILVQGRVVENPRWFLSDNSGAFVLFQYRERAGRVEFVQQMPRWQITDDGSDRETVLMNLRDGAALYLIHPQHYR